MDHPAEGFRGGALAPAAMPWRSAALRSLFEEELGANFAGAGRQDHKPLHDCPPSKSRPRYDPAVSGGCCPSPNWYRLYLGGPRRGFGGVPPAQDSNVLEFLLRCMSPEMGTKRTNRDCLLFVRIRSEADTEQSRASNADV